MMVALELCPNSKHPYRPLTILLISAIDYSPQVLGKLLNLLTKSMRWTFSIRIWRSPEEDGQISSA